MRTKGDMESIVSWRRRRGAIRDATHICLRRRRRFSLHCPQTHGTRARELTRGASVHRVGETPAFSLVTLLGYRHYISSHVQTQCNNSRICAFLVLFNTRFSSYHIVWGTGLAHTPTTVRASATDTPTTDHRYARGIRCPFLPF